MSTYLNVIKTIENIFIKQYNNSVFFLRAIFLLILQHILSSPTTVLSSFVSLIIYYHYEHIRNNDNDNYKY